VVLLDNFQGGYLATRHMLSLGHRQIGCIAGPSNVNPSAERLAGYKAALLEDGIEAAPSLVRRGEFQMETGWKMAHELLHSSPPPTAIFACNDLMAIGVLRAAAECGLHVPEDLSVVGFDNIELASYTVPPLTTIAQPTHAIGTRAVEILIARIKDPEQEIRHERLQAELVVRGSTTVKSTEAASPAATGKPAAVVKSTHTEVL
jgi:LacI family transcriptional regulator